MVYIVVELTSSLTNNLTLIPRHPPLKKNETILKTERKARLSAATDPRYPKTFEPQTHQKDQSARLLA